MLQVPNILRKPVIWIPAIVSSAVLGQIMTYQTMAPEIGGTMTMAIIVIFQILLPAVVTLAVSEFMRKKGWIKEGDMKLDL